VTAVDAPSPSWRAVHWTVLGVGLALAALIRVPLLPTEGLKGDLDQFVLWVHGIVTGGFGRAYDQNLSFPAVMVYIWGLLGLLEPAFRTVTESSDAGIRTLMKLPATLADFGLALGVAYALRARPWWAVAGALGIALHPAVIDVSAWWGQYESIYVLLGLVAYLLAVGGRPGWAAVALTLAVMAKPQALPFLVPFAAWYLAHFGWRGAVRYGLIGAGTAVVVWLPFLAAGGPLNYVRNLAEYQGGVFAVLSLRAWNPWWLVQEVYASGNFIADDAPIYGPVTLRVVGYVTALLLELLVFAAVRRRPTPAGLALGLAASVLVAFVTLTSMHERYAYAALVFLAVMLPERRVVGLWLALGVVLTVNLLAAIPPTEVIARVLPVSGPHAVLGSTAMVTLALAVILLLFSEHRVSLVRRTAAHAPA
jgi:Gpi18-like mannosyltransferase